MVFCFMKYSHFCIGWNQFWKHFLHYEADTVETGFWKPLSASWRDENHCLCYFFLDSGDQETVIKLIVLQLSNVQLFDVLGGGWHCWYPNCFVSYTLLTPSNMNRFLFFDQIMQNPSGTNVQYAKRLLYLSVNQVPIFCNYVVFNIYVIWNNNWFWATLTTFITDKFTNMAKLCKPIAINLLW